jgi:type IV pilus assembly protein PilP
MKTATQLPVTGIKPGRHSLTALLIAGLALFVAGCSDNLDDLRKYSEEVKARGGGRVPPLPEPKPFESFVYQAANARSPFEPWSKTQEAIGQNAASASGIQPDAHRRKETLEGYPLDTLRMVGSLAKNGQIWAIVKAPDGIVYRVTKNNHLGQNQGRITQVNEQKIDLIEIVPDGLGGWREKTASLELAE